MASIELRINADGPDDLRATLAKILGAHAYNFTVSVEDQKDANPEKVDVSQKIDVPATESTTGRRRGPKAKETDTGPQDTGTAGAQTAEAEPGSSGSATAASTATQAGAGSDTVVEITAAQVAEAAGAFSSRDGKSMMHARDLLMEHFKSAAGDPVKRLSDLQPADYAQAYALFAA